MMESLIARYHLHPIIDHFTIALLSVGVVADIVASVFLAPLAQRSAFLRTWHDRVKATSVQLLIVGALAVVLSRFTGESEAERLWDTMSPAAQRLLWSDAGSGRFLSHSVLGVYLMYAFISLALWRVLAICRPNATLLPGSGDHRNRGAALSRENRWRDGLQSRCRYAARE
jgi:uncharacterized membrane protein